MSAAEVDGDVDQLVQVLFGPNQPPGEIVVQDPAFRDPNVHFRFLVGLYLAGIRLYNDIPNDGPLPPSAALRAGTAEHLQTRMSRVLRIEPELIPARRRPLLPHVTTIFEPGDTLEACWLHSPAMGFSIKMRHLGAAHVGVHNPHLGP